MSTWKIIIPLLNCRVDTFAESIWHLSDNVYCRTITDSDYGSIWRYLDDEDDDFYRSIISPKTQCIYLDDLELPSQKFEEQRSEFIRNQAIIVQSLFNLYSEENPIVVSFAVVVDVTKQDNKSDGSDENYVSDIYDLKSIADHRLIKFPYKLKQSATKKKVNQTYRVITTVCNKHPEVYITLSRFNSGLTRVTDRDQIIDITTSLESLIRERNELRFKFAVYLSFVVKSDPQNRIEVFQLLATLYDARSGLVHGTPGNKDVKKALKTVREHWVEIVMIARSAIGYYVLYIFSHLNGKVQTQWKEHLKRLMLGVDNRIID